MVLDSLFTIVDHTIAGFNLYGVSVMSGLKFDEFVDKLQQVKEDFRNENGREVETVAELEAFVRRRKVRTKGRRHLTSLKGFDV